MFGNKKAKPQAEPDVLVPAVPSVPAVPQPTVVVVVENGRGRRFAPKEDADEDKGHPLLKTMLGVAVVKRMFKRRKRPLRARMARSLRKGSRKARKTVRKARRKVF